MVTVADYSLFPSILPDRDEPFVDDCYSAGELEKMEYQQLREIAANHESDAVHGKMGKQELKDELEGLERV